MKGTDKEKMDAMRLALWETNSLLHRLLMDMPLAKETREEVQDCIERNDFARMEH